MNLEKITEIVNSSDSDKEKHYQIIVALAEDPNSLLAIIEVVHLERLMKRDMISEMNLHLSKADCILENPKLDTKKNMLTEISGFYLKYADKIKHCFKS
jgi:hypothetical protein